MSRLIVRSTTGGRKIAALAISLFLLAPACNSRLLRPPATISVDGGELKVTASFGEVERAFPSVMLSFFPSRIALHPRDAVKFEMRYTGEPHTVALGRLVDSAVSAVDRLGARALDPRAVEALPEMRKLPSVLPFAGERERPRINRSASEPCFLDRGMPPTSGAGGARACPLRRPPDFDGTQSFYSSGFIPEGEGFRVKLSGRIRAGTYRFMCLVHRAAMSGSLEVREPSEERPAVRVVREDAEDEEREVTSGLEPIAREVLQKPPASPLAGLGPAGQVRGFLSAFVPEQLRARVGVPVTWTLFGTHSISFEPKRQALRGVVVQEGGRAKINLDAWRPVQSRPPPAQALAYPPRTSKLSIDGGTWSGEGRFSSGVLRATPPEVITYTMRFAKAGTYRLFCVVHDAMRGTVVVR